MARRYRISPTLFFLGSSLSLCYIVQLRSQSQSEKWFGVGTKMYFGLQRCNSQLFRQLLPPRQPNRSLLVIHRSVSSSFRGDAYSRQRDSFFGLAGDGRALKNSPTSTKFKPATEHNLDNFWSSVCPSNLCS